MCSAYKHQHLKWYSNSKYKSCDTFYFLELKHKSIYSLKPQCWKKVFQKISKWIKKKYKEDKNILNQYFSFQERKKYTEMFNVSSFLTFTKVKLHFHFKRSANTVSKLCIFWIFFLDVPFSIKCLHSKQGNLIKFNSKVLMN